MPLAKLPPHLRASVFFDEPSIKHNVEIKYGSAVATLESMLDAAARAPVAHTYNSTQDDDFDAALRPNPLNRRSVMPYYEAQKNRSSVMLVKPPSAGSSSLPEEKRLSLSDDIGGESAFEVDFGENEPEDRKTVEEPVTSPPSHSPPRPPVNPSPVELIHLAGATNDGAPSPSEDGGVSVIPSDSTIHPAAPKTLLAELEVRKQQLKSRIRTAAAAGPDGMHSTLLQLDSVAQVEERKRKTKRTTLAWEDPNEEQAQTGATEDDDEIPLAVLYATEKEKLGHNLAHSDGDRPLGLIQKKELEENEPLSNRRERLRSKALPLLPSNFLAAQQGRPTSISSEEETLAQRTRRLKTTIITLPSPNLIPQPLAAGPRPRALDAAKLAQTAANQPKRASTIRLLTQADSPKLGTISSSEDGETLGQRRRRLYKEANASIADRKGSLEHPARPDQPTRKSSLANPLDANPASPSTQSLLQMYPQSQLQVQPNPTHPPAGLGLLGQSLQMQAERKAHLQSTNLHASSYNHPFRAPAVSQAKYGLWPQQELQHQQQPSQPMQTYYIQQRSPALSQSQAGSSPYLRPGMYPSYASLVPAQVLVKPAAAAIPVAPVMTAQRGDIDRWRLSVQ